MQQNDWERSGKYCAAKVYQSLTDFRAQIDFRALGIQQAFYDRAKAIEWAELMFNAVEARDTSKLREYAESVGIHKPDEWWQLLTSAEVEAVNLAKSLASKWGEADADQIVRWAKYEEEVALMHWRFLANRDGDDKRYRMLGIALIIQQGNYWKYIGEKS